MPVNKTIYGLLVLCIFLPNNIGIEKTITKSKGNIVYTIDDEPAVDVFVKFFQFTASVYNRSEIIAANFAQYPLQLKKDNGNTVLRAPLMVDIENRALIFAGSVPQEVKYSFQYHLVST